MSERAWGPVADRLGQAAAADGEPTRWFEELWSAAARDEVDTPWDRDEPYPPVAALVDGTVPATDDDWDTEFLSMDIAAAVVDSLEGALAHIAAHSTGHTEAIVTEDAAAAAEFLDGIDSSVGLWNASTQFCDGGEFGFGAEIGIATGRLHARGPVGLEQLCTYRYHVIGSGQVRP